MDLSSSSDALCAFKQKCETGRNRNPDKIPYRWVGSCTSRRIGVEQSWLGQDLIRDRAAVKIVPTNNTVLSRTQTLADPKIFCIKSSEDRAKKHNMTSTKPSSNHNMVGETVSCVVASLLKRQGLFDTARVRLPYHVSSFCFRPSSFLFPLSVFRSQIRRNHVRPPVALLKQYWQPSVVVLTGWDGALQCS